jgi:hypothetical protein
LEKEIDQRRRRKKKKQVAVRLCGGRERQTEVQLIVRDRAEGVAGGARNIYSHH